MYELHCKYCKGTLDWEVIDHDCPVWGPLSVAKGNDFRRSNFEEVEAKKQELQEKKDREDKERSNRIKEETPHTYDISYLGFFGGI